MCNRRLPTLKFAAAFVRNRIIVTEAFVYLPNKEKKKYMHRLEAGLRTLKILPKYN